MGAVVPVITAVASLASTFVPLFAGGGSQPAPYVPPAPPPQPLPPPEAPEIEDPDIQKAKEDERRKRMMAQGIGDTRIAPLSEEDVEKERKTLLGD